MSGHWVITITENLEELPPETVDEGVALRVGELWAEHPNAYIDVNWVESD